MSKTTVQRRNSVFHDAEEEDVLPHKTDKVHTILGANAKQMTTPTYRSHRLAKRCVCRNEETPC